MPAYPATLEYTATGDLPVRVVRSRKRVKTISSQFKDPWLVVQVPAALDEQAERMLVEEMVKKYRQRQARTRQAGSDQALMERARQLDAQYYGSAARPVQVRWVENQNSRWGSATMAQRHIRLSSRLQTMPAWVQDYVLLHELAHLVEPRDGHGPRFKALLGRYARAAEANAYLRGYSTGYRARVREEGQQAAIWDGGTGEDDDGHIDDL